MKIADVYNVSSNSTGASKIDKQGEAHGDGGSSTGRSMLKQGTDSG